MFGGQLKIARSPVQPRDCPLEVNPFSRSVSRSPRSHPGPAEDIAVIAEYYAKTQGAPKAISRIPYTTSRPARLTSASPVETAGGAPGTSVHSVLPNPNPNACGTFAWHLFVDGGLGHVGEIRVEEIEPQPVYDHHEVRCATTRSARVVRVQVAPNSLPSWLRITTRHGPARVRYGGYRVCAFPRSIVCPRRPVESTDREDAVHLEVVRHPR